MPQSLSKLLVHLVFSTKHRAAIIPQRVQAELSAYIVGILRQHESPSLITNAVDDHVHVLFVLSK